MCSGRRYGSPDMPHDLFRSVHDLDLDLDLSQIFKMTFLGLLIVHSTHLAMTNTILAK